METNIKPFWQWKADILEEDYQKYNCRYYRWTKDGFYSKYGGYVQKMRDKNKIMKPKFNEKADKYLKDLYESVGAITPEQKYNTLFMTLGYHIDGTVINFSHSPTWEQKQGMMEYDILEREGLIDLVLA
jgi:hypothetical protein